MSSSQTYVCEYCNSTFTRKDNLTTHKKTTKLCMTAQNNLLLKNEVDSLKQTIVKLKSQVQALKRENKTYKECIDAFKK